MGLKRTDEFRRDAVRIALTSRLTRKQVANDLGVGLSTLNKWMTAHRDTDVVSKEDLSLAQDNDRLRRENRILQEERDILKKGNAVLRAPKAMRFRFIQEHRNSFPPTGCVTSWMSVPEACGLSATVQPAAGSGLILSLWPTSKNSPVSAWAATADPG